MDDVRKLFIDTSAWIAYSAKDDKNHSKIVHLFSKYLSNEIEIYTSNDIVDETVTRLAYDVGWYKARSFIEYFQIAVMKKMIIQVWTDEQIQYEAFSLLEKYKDHKFSLTDATSVVILRRFKIDLILTLDSDFRKIGISSLPELLS
ncbi:type II toxin-antitoxin system VapC family toxin [Candidatus Gottesmanbacteria bacterium]|nr:type II toxin-antitoxin system VapC family toxin [Candidatus Gottesmanbacteria bacterium]